MPETRTEILIKKVFESDFTWSDLENYFSINRNDLKDELKSFLKLKPDFNLRLVRVCNRLNKNEKKRQREIEYV